MESSENFKSCSQYSRVFRKLLWDFNFFRLTLDSSYIFTKDRDTVLRNLTQLSCWPAPILLVWFVRIGGTYFRTISELPSLSFLQLLKTLPSRLCPKFFLLFSSLPFVYCSQKVHRMRWINCESEIRLRG